MLTGLGRVSFKYSWRGLRGLDNEKNLDVQVSLGNMLLTDGSVIITAQWQEQAYSLQRIARKLVSLGSNE